MVQTRSNVSIILFNREENNMIDRNICDKSVVADGEMKELYYEHTCKVIRTYVYVKILV